MARTNWFVAMLVGCLIAGFFYYLGRIGLGQPALTHAPAKSEDDISKGPQKPPSPEQANQVDTPVGKSKEPVVPAVLTPGTEELKPGGKLSTPPKAVGDKVRVRQTLKPGKTYQTLTHGTLHSRGYDSAWGLKSTVSINHAFEAAIDRDILSNDGENIVERRHFRTVRSVKIDVDLEDVRIDLKSLSGPILSIAESIWPDESGVVRMFDKVSLKPLLEVLRKLGIRPEKLTGHDAQVVKVFTQFDSLQGKSVEIEYRDGKGVKQPVVPLVGDILPSERFLHVHSVLLSDALIFPDPEIDVGKTWTVEGRDFSNLIDPGLRAAVEGELTLRREENLPPNMGGHAVLKVLSAGRSTWRRRTSCTRKWDGSSPSREPSILTDRSDRC